MNTNWTREALKFRAKDVLRVNYWPALLVSILLGIATGGFSSGGSSNSYNYQTSGEYNEVRDFFAERPELIIGSIVLFIFLFLIGIAFKAFVGGPLEVSCQKFFVTSAVEPHSRLEYLGFGFKKEHYMNLVKTMFLRTLYLFLWTLLFIIPGIIKAYAYRMVPYIMSENPNMDTNDAINKSVKMMDGEKWNTFVLDLSFIGWYILGLLACCIGVIFVAPYQNSTNAQLYCALKEKYDMSHEQAYEPSL